MAVGFVTEDELELLLTEHITTARRAAREETIEELNRDLREELKRVQEMRVTSETKSKMLARFLGEWIRTSRAGLPRWE
jgi:hypothetical protein